MDILKYSEKHRDFRRRLRDFLAKEVVPHVDRFEKNHRVPKKIWQKMGRAGFLCPCLPPGYGGLGGDFLYAVIVAEEMALTNHTGLAVSLHSDIVVPYIESFASETLKKKYLPGCISGDIITAVAMTEPGAGSDVASMTTTAVEEGEGIVINGTKTFISNAVNCDLVVLAAVDPSIEKKHQAVSLYLVEAGVPGFKKGEPLEKMGWNSQDTGELFFTNCRIPKENRLGDPGMGFLMLMQKLQQERLVCAMGGIYGAEYILNWTTDYCKKTAGNGKALI
jgi:alkylation response protein AidB-like acyl-CoA dehydrogenase